MIAEPRFVRLYRLKRTLTLMDILGSMTHSLLFEYDRLILLMVLHVLYAKYRPGRCVRWKLKLKFAILIGQYGGLTIIDFVYLIADLLIN